MKQNDLDKIRKEKPINRLLDFSIINLDKPTGPTSFEVDLLVKEKLGLRKTGHLGTLDPATSGVLPIALNRACNLMPYFLKKDKHYIGIMRLHKETTKKELMVQINKFTGLISQLPPVRSQVKRRVRERMVHKFTVLEIDGKDVLFETFVEAGTYIRKLVHDLGESIGGAHMLELRRTKASIFEETDSVTLYDLDNAIRKYRLGDDHDLRDILIPGEIVQTLLPSLKLKEEFLGKCLNGSPIMKNYLESKKLPEIDEIFCIQCAGQFVGCYRRVQKGEIIAVPEFVLN